ncbi:MAG: hypothetical protein GY719_23330 [bacterium]|nr:hypothetical protein [bacterium]
MEKKLQSEGTLGPDDLYIERPTDNQLHGWLTEGRVCYVVGSRRAGKSSLAKRMIWRLEEQGYRGCKIDFDKGSVDAKSEEEWYRGLVLDVGKSLLHWRYDQSLNWWHEHALVTPLPRWGLFLEEAIPASCAEEVVIFFDELEAVRRVEKSLGTRPGLILDDFLLAIRALCNERSTSAGLRRLHFCFLGTLAPADLIADASRSDFNVAEPIYLEDFSLAECKAFLPPLEKVSDKPWALLKSIFQWTEGHPSMTQKLVKILTEQTEPGQANRALLAELIKSEFLRSGRQDDFSLSYAETRMSEDERNASVVEKLELYQDVLRAPVDLRPGDPVQLALRLAGIAAQRRDEDFDELVLSRRNRIFERVFDRVWLQKVRSTPRPPIARLETRAAEEPVVSSPGLERMTRIVDQLFCEAETAQFGPFERLGQGAELLAGMLFQFSLQDEASLKTANLVIFHGLGELGGEMWEQEVRSLARLSARSHESLPRILMGGKEPERNLAFIVTEAAYHTLDEPGAIEFLRRNRLEGVRQFMLLADALSLMHGNGIQHRNLWAGAVEVLDTESLRLRLSRFEMTSLVSNLLRRVGAGQEPRDSVQRFFESQGRYALACAPPERLALLYPDRVPVAGTRNHPRAVADTREDARADVFGLAVLAYQWLVEALPGDLVEAAFPASGYDHDTRCRLDETMRHRIEAVRLPQALRVLLLEMLEFERLDKRPTSARVVEDLHRNWEEITDFWATTSELPHVLACIPRETGAVLRNRSLMSHDTESRAGIVELLFVISDDLRNGVITYSPEGAAPYLATSDPRLKEAHYAIIGRHSAYFCEFFESRKPWQEGSGGLVLEQVLIARYVVPRERVGRLDNNPLRKRLPPIELLPIHAKKLQRPEMTADHPSWKPLLRSIERADAPPWHINFGMALDWLLKLQKVEIDARCYAVEVDDQIVTYDETRDKYRIHNDDLFDLYAEKSRLRASDFFQKLWDSERQPMLVQPDEQGKPGRNRYLHRVAFYRRWRDPGAFEVEWKNQSAATNEKAWVRPRDDHHSEALLREQMRARHRLLEIPALVDQLDKPVTMVHQYLSWPDVGEGLEGNAPEVIQALLSTLPFFAIQGPPGTGKTEVASRAIAHSLWRDRSLRILVSAQSHFALDNLAERILKRVGELGLSDDVQILRVASKHAKPSEVMAEYRLSKQVPKRIREIENNCRSQIERLAGMPENQTKVEVLEEWRKEVRESDFEIRSRIRRGANLVFVTCGSATDRHLVTGVDFDAFDWVFVEEAAKAWPTELAMPLVHGIRWALIGDHKQLKAFRRMDVERILAACAQKPKSDLREHGERQVEYVRVFDLFKSLFDDDDSREIQGFQRKERPFRMLEWQFRMRPEIAAVVSEAFYDGKLKTHRKAAEREHGLTSPPWLVDQALVWLDTSTHSDRWEGPRENKLEVRLVRALVQQLWEGSGRDEKLPERLTILSPYTAQLERLKGEIDRRFLDCLHTLDSFQGREADIVIVSLVRCNGASRDSPIARLGFLTEHNRVNVLFSRARVLLILVGSYDHFAAEDAKDEDDELFDASARRAFWPVVCEQVRRHGKILRVDGETNLLSGTGRRPDGASGTSP